MVDSREVGDCPPQNASLNLFCQSAGEEPKKGSASASLANTKESTKQDTEKGGKGSAKKQETGETGVAKPILKKCEVPAASAPTCGGAYGTEGGMSELEAVSHDTAHHVMHTHAHYLFILPDQIDVSSPAMRQVKIWPNGYHPLSPFLRGSSLKQLTVLAKIDSADSTFCWPPGSPFCAICKIN